MNSFLFFFLNRFFFSGFLCSVVLPLRLLQREYTQRHLGDALYISGIILLQELRLESKEFQKYFIKQMKDQNYSNTVLLLSDIFANFYHFPQQMQSFTTNNQVSGFILSFALLFFHFFFLMIRFYSEFTKKQALFYFKLVRNVCLV